ncbi:MAG TPA: hypothetical protein VIP70_04440 [Nitrososphaeraceae archaeon]
MTLQNYMSLQSNSTEGYHLLDSSTTMLAGLRAYRSIFTNIEGLKIMQLWTIKEDKVYTITYTAEEENFENDLQTAQRMVDSFQITN